MSDMDQLKVVKIPAKISGYTNDVAIETKKKRVCAYCRVSTEEEDQISSFELQKSYYNEMIQSKPDWELVRIYADYGKSGTSTDKRTEFVQMIEDCISGGIDLIVTKSISRFARNTLDCLNYVRRLKNLEPPVGIFFEKENLDSLDPQGELLLTILSSLAQEEARNTSENLKWAIRKRFEAGKPMCPTNYLLGYMKDENGKMVIQEEEAKIVRRIFKMYQEGKGAGAIANQLKGEGVPSARGGSAWGKNSIFHILRNERYCGDIIMQKDFTADFLTHKRKRNKGELPQYYIKDHHPAIIKRSEWENVQAEIRRRQGMAMKEDRAQRIAYSSVSVLSNRLFCAHCGQPLTRKTATLRGGGVKKIVTIFRCRATSAKSRRRGGLDACNARCMQERKIKEAFMETLMQLKEDKADFKTKEGTKALTKALTKILDSISDTTHFEDRYFRDLVEKGVVYDDGSIRYFFKNGFECTSYIKLERKTTKRKPKTQRA